MMSSSVWIAKSSYYSEIEEPKFGKSSPEKVAFRAVEQKILKESLHSDNPNDTQILLTLRNDIFSVI